MHRRQFIAAFGIGALPFRSVLAEPAAESKPLISGLAAGKEVPSFFVRAITGPQMNRSVCFVCRNGDRPVVMVMMRRLESGSSVEIGRAHV